MKTLSLTQSLLLVSPFLSSALPTAGPNDVFDPEAYTKTFVTCPAWDRSGATPQKINLRLAYIDVNPTAKKTLIMAHGWPSLWTTYRHQINYFKTSEYRLIVPEHRGFGDSQHPKDLGKSNTFIDVRLNFVLFMQRATNAGPVCR